MKYITIFTALLLAQAVAAQTVLKVIKATSKKVSVNDGGYFDKDVWNLSPRARPDVYTADRTRKTKWVTFYTDIDSIRVKVKPGMKYNFVILLNGKDSCYTQIASAIPEEGTVKNTIAANDTIPFTLTPANAIQVRCVINNADTLNLHFDVGSFDFRLTKDAILNKTKLLQNQPDAIAGKAKPNYNNLSKVHTVQIGNIVWNDPVVGATTVTSTGMDGRFGWNLFEGKQVEIDYDKSLLIIHSRLPKGLKGYAKSKLQFIRSFVCVDATFVINNKKYSGYFLMDTGSDQAIIVDSSWAAEQGFPKDLKLIKLSTIRDPRGVQYESKIVLAPMLKVNGLALTNIPTYMLGSANPTGFEINFLGNGLLKRFNIILDFKNDNLYLKPNKLMREGYGGNS